MPRQLSDYLIQDADKEGPYHPGTPICQNSRITPLIDGETYFNDLIEQIDSLGGAGTERGIYIAGWNIKEEFEFPKPDKNGDKNLLTILEKKKLDGVDVRVLAWANDYLVDTSQNLSDLFFLTEEDIVEDDVSIQEKTIGKVPHYQKQNDNFITIQKMRSGALNNCAMLNTLDHPFGAVHMKYVVIYDGSKVIGYSGGIDFVPNRIATNLHHSELKWSWHDVQVKVEGDAAQAMYNHFKDLWNSLLGRAYNPKFLYKPPLSTSRTIITGKSGGEQIIPDKTFSQLPINVTHSAQSLRTIPNMDWPWFICSEDPVFATNQDGIFEIQLALKKVIQHAEKFIYIEDQGFWSRDLFSMLSEAVVANNDLKVILVTGLTDPDDAPTDYDAVAINEYLMRGLSNEQQKGRVRMFSRRLETVHSKVWIVDDKWAMIGSANMFNRSLYTDIEHALSFADVNDVVKRFRINLWGEHFGLAPFPNTDRLVLTDLDKALNIWEPSWGTAGSGIKLPCHAESINDIPESNWDVVRQPLISKLISCSGFTVRAEDYNAAKITDPALPPDVSEGEFYSASLKNLMVHFKSGPNMDSVRYILAHEGNTLTLNKKLTAPNPIGGAATFDIYAPRLQPIILPRPGQPEDKISYFNKFKSEYIDDAGEHP